MYVKVNPTAITLEKDFTRDVSELGHFGTGDLGITIGDPKTLSRAQSLIDMSHEAS